MVSPELKQSNNTLEQRDAELAIINEIQQGLAKELDFQAIVDLVGDKIREIFHSENVNIRIYDPNTHLVSTPYLYENGTRIHLAPLLVTDENRGKGFTGYVMENRKTLVINENLAQALEDYESYILPGTESEKSAVFVPLVIGDVAYGVVNLSDMEHEHAFSDSDVRLLETLVNSMSVALENARLFDETQRLVKAERERVTELEIINSIQKGLAAELDFQSIVDLVGDELREVFNTPDLLITWYEEKTDLIHRMYVYEHGQRLYLPSSAPTASGPFSRMRQTRQPVIWNTAVEGDQVTGGIIPGTDRSLAGVMIPIVSSDRVTGIIQVENYEQENAFGEAELRLLTTIAASLGSALENARLFDETQRLLKETEQRNAELAILNSVSDALSKNLNVDTIIKIVGDQVRDTFNSEVTTIHFYNPQINQITTPYYYDHGYVESVAPFKLGEGLTSLVIQKREPVLLSTVEEETQAGGILVQDARGEGGDTKSYLGVPIMVGNKIIGVVSIQSYQEHAFQQSHVSLLSTLASTMSVAIANARQFQAEQERVAELEIINSIQQGLAKELDFQSIVDLVGDKLSEVLHTDNLGIRWYDEKTNLMYYFYEMEKGNRFPFQVKPPQSEGIFHQWLKNPQNLQPVVFNTAQEVLAQGLVPGTEASKSTVSLPIIAGDRLIGMIHDENFEHEYAYGESELRLLTTIAASLGTALENARLFDETQRLLKETEQRNAELAVINTVQAALAAELNIQGIYDAVGDKIREIFHTGNVAIRIYDPQTNLLSFPYTYEKGVRLSMETGPLPEKGFSAHVIRTRETLVVNENIAEVSKKYGSFTIPGTLDDKSSLLVPLVVGDQAHGLVYLADFERENAYSESDVRLLQTLVNSMSVALENARLFDETQRLLKETEQRNAELGILNSVSDALSKNLNVDAIIKIVGDQVRDTFKSEVTTIHLYDPSLNLVTTPYAYDRGYIYPLDFAFGEGLTSRVIQKREPIVLQHAAEGEAYSAFLIPDAEGQEGSTESYLGVPIIVGDKVIGVVSVQSYQQNAYQANHVSLLSTLSSTMGVAIANARQFQAEQERVAELEIINSIQKGLAEELDFQAIIDLVGDKLREVFKTGDLGISWWDEKSNLVHYMYTYEHGKRIHAPAAPPREGGIYETEMRTRRPYILSKADITANPPMPGTDPSLSAAFIPIISGDRFLGDISVESYQSENAFGEAEIRLLTTIAASLGAALENARLFDETQRLLAETEQRNSELAIINSVQAALAAELNIQGIYDAVGDKIREIFHSDNLEIRIWDSKTNLEHIPYIYEKGERLQIKPFENDNKGFGGYVARTRETLVINENLTEEVEKYGSYIVQGTLQPKSVVYVPLLVGDQVRGMVGLSDFNHEHAFSDSDVRLLQTLVNSMSVALENARLFNETQRLLAETEQRNSELAIINSVQAALAAELNIQGIYDAVGDKIREIFHSDNLEIRIFNLVTNQVEFPYLFEKGERKTPAALPLAGGISAHILRTRETLVVNENVTKMMEELGSFTVPGTEDSLSVVFVPLIVGDQVRGLVALSDYEREGAFSESDVRLLQTLVNSMSVALENARLFNETQRLLAETEQRNSELAIINSVQAALAAELNIQGIYDAVGDKIREIFHSDNLEIRIFDYKNNQQQFPYIYEDGERVEIENLPTLDVGFSKSIIKTRQTILINENMSQELEKYGTSTLPGTLLAKSFVIVPLIVGDQVRGAVSLSDFNREHAFSQSDVRLLQTLGNSMSVALENARLFNETQRLLAETEQRNSELAIINSVQAALAAELNIQGIYDAVGDKIRQIFQSDNLEIRIWDPRTNMEHLPYLYEKGERIEVEAVPREDKGFGAYISRTRETLVLNENIQQEVEKYGSYLVPGTESPKSQVYVPLVVGDQVRGMIGMADFEHEHAFSESDVRLLQTLVNSMSVALENARLFNETQRLLEETSQRANELSIINHVSQSMSRQLQVGSIVRTVGDQVRDTLHSEVVNIYLYDAANQLIHLPYSWDREYVESEPFPYGKGLTSKILDTRQPMILGSFEDIVEAGALLNPNSPTDELMPQSYLGVPIVVGEKAIGAIDVQSYTQCVYDDSHVRLLSTLASSMGVALENARLFEETRRLLAETEARNRELAIISRVGQALAGQLDPQGIYELVGEELKRVFDTQVVAIITYDRQENLAYWRYSIEKGIRQNISPRAPIGFSGHILRTREPLLLKHDVDRWAEQYGSKVVAGEAPKSYLGVPLIAGGEVTGLIALQNIDREEAFSENDLRLLSTLALNMGVALENARLYQETQHHAVEMAALAEIGSDIASTHEMEPVLERMATKTRELMEVRDIALYLLQPDGQTLKPIVSQGKYAAETMAQPILLGSGMTGSIAQSGVAEIINEPELDHRAVHIEGTPEENEEAECLMVAPLISRGKAIGVISVYRDREQGSFTQIELDFLVSLARQAAIAIESARLYAETERRATEMAALAEVSREISATLELQVVLERIAGQALDLLDAPNSAVYLLQPDGETIKAIAAEGDIAKQVMVDEIRLGTGMIGNIIKNGKAEWIDNTARDPRAIHIAGTKDIDEGEKLLVAPLLTQDRAIGALAVWRNADDPTFNQAELSFAINLAQQAVVAIENARLFEAAQESQRRMADIIDFLPDATFVVDREGKVIAWNHAIEEMTGVRADEIVGKGDYEYSLPFYEERRPVLIDMVLLPDEEIEKKYSHIQRTDGVLVGETIAPVLRGRITYLNATASALINSKGEVVGAIESIRDITDQKKAEQELHQAKADAEAANQAKSAFLAMMSHEIRTPMNAIIGMSGLLMDTQLSPDQREFAETIRSSGDSLLTIINDILDFSKVEAGKMILEEVPFNLRECVEASLDLVKVRASEKNLELAYQIEPGVPQAILGDVTRLRQVLINLLGNSVKFTEQGEIVLTVSQGKESNFLHFSVRDTGIGIPPDRIGVLFRAFTQADASTSRRYGGTGLGLALSNRIVDLMGGKIWVESEGVAGKGSIFHFDIFAKPAPVQKEHALMEGEQPLLRGKRLLLVDDNATNRRILQLQTQVWGMISTECASPAEALEVLGRGQVFDLAIIDMQMPDMSGVELADEICKLEAERGVKKPMPLVLSTSLGGREEARESSEFAAILLKPIRQSALYDMLMSLFAGQTSPEEKQPVEKAALDPQMASRHPLHILLAEDNVVNQKLALRLLSQMGYRADIAANGLEVLQAVKRQPYDVILMDVQMPEMDGLEATRRLCAELPKEKRPRIIAMTANAMQGDREMCLAAGMDDYLSKPIRVDELVSALNQARPLAAV